MKLLMSGANSTSISTCLIIHKALIGSKLLTNGVVIKRLFSTTSSDSALESRACRLVLEISKKTLHYWT